MKDSKEVKLLVLGDVVSTPGALDKVGMTEIFNAIQRHQRHDWGDLCAEDKQVNQEGLENEGRIMSAYTTPQGVKFWVITEADRSVTTALLPDEY